MRIILIGVVVLLTLFGLGAVLYGVVKIAQAEPQERQDVVVNIGGKEEPVLDPEKPALRELGVKSAGVGALCMFLAGVGTVFLFRKRTHTA
jgi:hypothetical protein